MRSSLLPFLDALLALREAGSVTGAAQRLHRTQPAISYQLRQLESAFGATLFVRRGGRLVPTPACDRLYALTATYAREIEAVRVPNDAGSITVASVAAFGRHVVFPALCRLRPLPQIRIEFPSADEVARRVSAGQADVGFSFRPTSCPGVDEEPAAVETLTLAAAPSIARRLKSPADLAGVSWITWDDGDFVFGRWLGHHLGRRSPPIRRAAHCQELEEVLALVAAGAGVSVLPDFVAKSSAGVKTVDWGRRPLTNTLFALRRTGDVDRPLVDALLAQIGARTRARHPSTASR